MVRKLRTVLKGLRNAHSATELSSNRDTIQRMIHINSMQKQSALGLVTSLLTEDTSSK